MFLTFSKPYLMFPLNFLSLLLQLSLLWKCHLWYLLPLLPQLSFLRDAIYGIFVVCLVVCTTIGIARTIVGIIDGSTLSLINFYAFTFVLFCSFFTPKHEALLSLILFFLLKSLIGEFVITFFLFSNVVHNSSLILSTFGWWFLWILLLMHKQISKDFCQYQGRLIGIFLISLVVFDILIPSIWLTTYAVTPLWAKCEDEIHTPKSGDLESSRTPKNSELVCRRQNTSHWGVLYINRKVLKFRCPKWPRMSHLDICSPSYRQKKGRESNWQFDSRPLKVRNRPLPNVCKRSAIRHWKAPKESYNFDLDLTPIKGRSHEI